MEITDYDDELVCLDVKKDRVLIQKGNNNTSNSIDNIRSLTILTIPTTIEYR